VHKLHIVLLSLVLAAGSSAQARGGAHGGYGGRGVGGGGARGFGGGGYGGSGFAGGWGHYGSGWFGGYRGYVYGRGFWSGFGFGLGVSPWWSYWPSYSWYGYYAGYSYPYYPYGPYSPYPYYPYGPYASYLDDSRTYHAAGPVGSAGAVTYDRRSYPPATARAYVGDGKWHHFGEKPGPVAPPSSTATYARRSYTPRASGHHFGESAPAGSAETAVTYARTSNPRSGHEAYIAEGK
jgi:hypothetical protein